MNTQIVDILHQKMKDLYSITNPNSTYIKVGLKFKGYNTYHLHAYIDTRASMCVASRYVFPEDNWKQAPKDLIVRIANNTTIKLNQVLKDTDIMIGGENFHIPTIYQQEQE